MTTRTICAAKKCEWSKRSRTIADLDAKADISSEHVSEAIQYRTFDRTLWV